MANESYVGYTQDAIYESEGLGTLRGAIAIGNNGGAILNGAIRFTSINIPQGTTVNSASLHLFQNHSCTGQLKFITNGFDEDNTSDFGGGWPGDRDRTTAQDTADNPVPSLHAYKQITVTSIVNEILARGSWSSGNAMGFIMHDNGSDTNTYLFNQTELDECYLVITINSLPDFTPTPKLLSANIKTQDDDYGMEIFTDKYISEKKALKVVKSGFITCGASSTTVIRHNLQYYPSALVYAETPTKVVKYNRLYISSTDPLTGAVQGYYWVTKDALKIYSRSATNLYYYIFADPI